MFNVLYPVSDMKKHEQSKSTKRKPQIGIRLDADLTEQIRKYSETHDRSITWVVTKVLRLGWPLFVETARGASSIR